MSDPESLSETWGSFPVCVLVSAALNGCLTMQMYTYYHKYFHRDHPVLKYTVLIIWVSSVFHVMCAFWVVHNICVAGYSRPTNEITIPIGLSMECLMQAFISFCVQGVYVSRLFRFSQNACLLACLCVPLAAEAGVGIFSVWRVARTVPAWQVDVWNEEWSWIVTAPFVICVFMDVAIAVSMCYQLWRSRMSGLKRTRNVVDKLMRWTIQTGLLSCSLALVIVFIKNVQKDTYVWVGISALASDCYANGLLALLNARTNLNLSDTTDHLSLPTAVQFAGISTSVGIWTEPESDR